MITRRRRWSRAEKRELVLRQPQSGFSVTEFCQREGVAAASFYRWRQEMDNAADGGSLSTAVSPAAAFVELGPLRPNAGRLALRLDLGEGVVLEITRG